MVELVEISKGEKKEFQKPSQNKKSRNKLIPIPAEKTKPVKAITPIKPIAPPKSIEPIRQSIQMPLEPKTQKVRRKASNPILNTLNQLNNSPERMDNELDQFARLVPKVSIKKPVIRKSKPIQERTFDEMNALKNKKTEVLPSKVEPLSMEETLDVEPPPDEKTDSRLEELQFASLSKNPLNLATKQDEKSSVELLKELAEMKQPPLVNKEPPPPQNQEIKVPPNLQTPEKSQAFDSILKKLDSLTTKPKDIDTNIVVPETLAQNFQSDIRKVSVPKRVQVDVVISLNSAYVKSSNLGKPSADALALYKGMIVARVFGNWDEPLGGKYNKEVIYSFNIYPKGNIDRLDLKKSSKVELLDSLALRAIHDSKPFPKFPKSLDFQNLNISIHFKYIPEETAPWWFHIIEKLR